MKKRILKLVFALCIVSTVLCAAAALTASAASSGTCGENLTWVLDDSGTLTISGTGPMRDFYSDNALWRYEGVVNIKIEEGVTSIGNYAFCRCTTLKTIFIPSTITHTGNYIYYDHGGRLESVYISDMTAWCNINFGISGNPLGSGNLYLNNEKVTELVIPDDVKEIKALAFSTCNSLTKVTIPDSVTSIGSSAFSNCASLTKVTIPDSVTSIGSNAFRNCDSLTNITIPDSVESIEYSVFCSCDNLTSISLGDGLTTIGDMAFDGCGKLTNVTIPDSVTSLGEDIFTNCTSLKKLTIPFIGSSRDANGTSDALFGYLFRDSTINSGTTQYYSPTASVEYNIPDSLRSVTITDASIIPYGAFYNCSTLDNITLNSGVKTIYADAFYNCSNLVDLTIPGKKVKFANSNVFTGCDMLTVYGLEGSGVDEYAQKYSIDFEAADISAEGATALSATATALEGNIVITIKANGSTAEKYIPVAIYDNNGKMLDLMIVPSNEDFDVAKVVFKDINSASYARLFLWSTYSNLTPLATAKQVTIVR